MTTQVMRGSSPVSTHLRAPRIPMLGMSQSRFCGVSSVHFTRKCATMSMTSSAVQHQASDAQDGKQNKPAAAAAQNLNEKRSSKGLWRASQHVQVVGVEEAEELYLSLVQRTNEQHVLMVLYAPWCPHCQAIEQEIESLAGGLAHQRDLLIVALNIDPPAARYFSKEVLGVSTLPSFVLFPRESRTFYKYKGKGRDAQSLLKFLNMVCNQSADQVWQLGGTAVTKQTGLRLHIGSSILPHVPALDTHASWTAASMALAAVAVLAKYMANRSNNNQAPKGTDSLVVAPPRDGNGGLPSTRHLSQQIDGVMGRMGGLMVKLAGARVSLGVIEAQTKVGILAAPASQQLAAAPALPSAAAIDGATSEATPVHTIPAPPQEGHASDAEASIAAAAVPAPVAQAPTASHAVAVVAEAATDIPAAATTVVTVPVAAAAPAAAAAAAAAAASPPAAVADLASMQTQDTAAAQPEGKAQPQLPSAQPSAVAQTAPAEATQRPSSPLPSGPLVVAAAMVLPAPPVQVPSASKPATALLDSFQSGSDSEVEAPSVSAEQAVSGPLPGQATEALLTGEELQLATGAFDTQELLRLLDEEGNDVDKVVQRLLQKNLPLTSTQ